MQRRERSTEETGELFQLDHLTTRVRRNVEKLITLAGATPARRWRRPVPLLDVARGAVAEVPDYHRVLIAPHWPWSLAGPAVTDVIHLLAELIENALAFSGADTTVRVSGEQRPQGCAVLVVDDGPGLDAAALAEANHLLGNPPPDGPPAGSRRLVRRRRTGRPLRRPRLAAPQPARWDGRRSCSYPPGWSRSPTPAAHRPTHHPTPRTRRPAPAPTCPTPNGDGALPTRVRHPGPTGPEHGRTSLDTVELPVARTARRQQ